MCCPAAYGCGWLSTISSMKAGEAAEFDTRTPHWFGGAGPQPAELLVLFGPQGERMHVRARPRARRQPP